GLCHRPGRAALGPARAPRRAPGGGAGPPPAGVPSLICPSRHRRETPRMFFHRDLKGFDLPPKALCLTYDDGPGRDTLELGHYLFAQGIRATFFVVGRHAQEQPETLAELSALGHVLDNHTYTHPGLVALAEAGGDVAGEI